MTGSSLQLGTFGDRLDDRVRRRQTSLVLGLDPHPMRLWPTADGRAGGREDSSLPPAVRAGRAVAAHCARVIDAVAADCVAVKLQLACFERLGAPGWDALAATVRAARAAGLLVIADAKRGDIDVSAAAYAAAFFGDTETPYGSVPGLGVDALTVSPLLGADSLVPFVDAAREVGGGLFVLVRTSNPGAADLQDQALAGGAAVSDQLATLVDRLGAAGRGPRGGLSDIGAVVGATAPERIAGLRELLPHAPLLIPGVGAQGGTVEALEPAFAPGPAGGLPSASRSIVDAYLTAGGDPAAAAAQEAARLREAAWRVAATGSAQPDPERSRRRDL